MNFTKCFCVIAGNIYQNISAFSGYYRTHYNAVINQIPGVNLKMIWNKKKQEKLINVD